MAEHAFTKMIDLAAEKLGGRAITCSDDFFAEKENLLKPGRGIFIADKYTDRGKWMDGWESRRKRTQGNDWCIVQLAAPGRIYGVDIDTNFFLGNHPPFASIDACYHTGTGDLNTETQTWKELLSKSSLQPGSQNLYTVEDKNVYTHLRLNIFPDGGVARLKVYGVVEKDWESIDRDEHIDLAAAINGGKPVLCNDMFFSHMDNLVMPGRGLNMGDGWETKRNRTPGNRDWVVVQLAHTGIIDKVLIDTAYFKGNYPDSCRLEGYTSEPGENVDFSSPDIKWVLILPQVKLQADAEHYFEELVTKEPFTHVRLSIFPDGGISRMRLFGHISQ